MAVNITNSYDLAEKLFKFCSSTITYLDDEDNYHKYLVMVGNTPFEILIGYSKHKNTSIRLIDRQYDEEIYSGTIKNDDDLRDINVCSYEISEIVYDIITNDVSGEEYFSETQLLRNRPVKSIFDEESQDTHAGGSGCACSALMLSAVILPKLASGEWKRVLFVPTGALLSQVSANEGRTIPAIAHAVWLESGKE